MQLFLQKYYKLRLNIYVYMHIGRPYAEQDIFIRYVSKNRLIIRMIGAYVVTLHDIL